MINYCKYLTFGCFCFLCANVYASEINFFSEPDLINLSLSPDGSKIAAIRNVKGKAHLVKIDTKTLQEETLLNVSDYSDNDSDIRQLLWIDNQFIATQLNEQRSGIEDLISTKVSQRLLIIDSTLAQYQNVYSVRTPGWLVSPQSDKPNIFLYAKSGIRSKVYKIDVRELSFDKKKLGKLDKVDGGQFKISNVVKSVDGFALRWYLDQNSRIIAALYYASENKKLTLSDISGEDVNIINTWEKSNDSIKLSESDVPLEEDMVPIEIADMPGVFYCLDANAEKETSIFKVDYNAHTVERVYETQAFQILDILIDMENQLLGAQVLKNGAIDYEYIGKDYPKMPFARSESASITSLIDISEDREVALYYFEAHNQPGQFFILRAGAKTPTLIGENYPQATNLQSHQQKGSISVDELEIPYLLNTPFPPKSGKKFPLIVLPHGGPIGVFDHEYYDENTQYFVSQGFAILRVNFRGSSGHSNELRDAGKKEFGRGMLNDIISVTHEVTRLDFIDQKHVCAVGFSYGGYAAVSLALRYPDTFNCAASGAGVMDVTLYSNSAHANAKQRSWLKEFVGDTNSELENLKAISPVYNIPSLSRPIFIAHGMNDRIVDIEHAFRMKLMLDKYNKPYEWFIDEKSGHNFESPGAAKSLFDAIITFVRKNI